MILSPYTPISTPQKDIRFLSNQRNTTMPPKRKTPAKKDPQPAPAASSRTRTRSGDLGKSPDKQPEKKVKADDVAKEPAKKPTATKKEQPQEEKEMKKMVMTGTAPVDEYFPNKGNAQVVSQGGKTYAATLNQSNVQANNNKFYILQVLESTSGPKTYWFFTRWGRVGVPGQQAAIVAPDIPFAIREYTKKLNSKLSGGYRQIMMNYEADDKEDEEKPKKASKSGSQLQPQVESNLPDRVQNLVRLIFDMKMMNNQMKEIGYDAKKMPLGKLAKESILKGYEALKSLAEEIKGKKRQDIIARLSSDFYSQIPHDFGFQKMQNFILNDEKKIKQKLEMLQSLEDIQVFTRMLDQGDIAKDINQLDNNYLKLKTTLKPLDPKSDTYQLLVDYVRNTHASTHTAYNLEVVDILEVEKEAEQGRYTKHIPNKQLLWHGSRLTNFVGILGQGLRIAPPEAPVTGYMFGKGVYFADMVTKSANYCFTNPSNNTGLMLLCEVALGDCNQKFYADYYANLLPPGKMSTKGCGKTAPSGGKFLGDVFVPCQKGASTGIAHTSLLYNEFIVYDVAQIKCRYLFRMKFHYGGKRGY